MEINSKLTMCSFLLIIWAFSCSGNQDKSETAETRIPVRFNKVYYWKENTDNSFLAARFDSSNHISCTIFSFGSTPLNVSEKQYLVKATDQESYQIVDTVQQQVEATFSVDSLGTIVLGFSKDARKSYQMVADNRFQVLFNKLKAKNNFRCVPSHDVSYNRILGYQTKANAFLSHPEYNRVIERYDDEIYGSGEFHYLDYNGNRFYYSDAGEESIIYKIEIFNSNIQTWYLDIKIGHSVAETVEKLQNQFVPFDRQSKSIYIRICNSAYEGKTGHLIFSFNEKLSDPSAVLSKITYEPFYDGE